MRIRILSDLHTEGYNFKYISQNEDVLVLAGDIGVGLNAVHWIKHSVPKQLPVVYVLGNHEYYDQHFEDTNNKFKELTKGTNIHVLLNDEIIIDSVRFLGSTLWSNFELYGIQNAWFAEKASAQGINDFYCIKTGNPERQWNTQDCKNEFEQAEKFLKFKLHEPFAGKTVVVTHFCPGDKSVAERYKMSTITPFFSSNCEHLMGFSELWIHGHTHDSFSYKIAETQVTCNPKGYGPGDRCENGRFNPNLIVEI